MRWYEKAMPTVKDIASFVDEAAISLRTIKGVKAVHTFGSFAENISNPKFNVKDVDLLVECRFESGDLLAIDCGATSPLYLSRDDLEEEGFDPDCVAFTKKCLDLRKMSFDMWAIAKDQVLLHWGAMPESVEEWKEIRKKAEIDATIATGLKRANLCSASESERKSWKTAYDQTIQNFVNDHPTGWYASTADPKQILKQSIKI
jgi:hypothetical protein